MQKFHTKTLVTALSLAFVASFSSQVNSALLSVYNRDLAGTKSLTIDDTAAIGFDVFGATFDYAPETLSLTLTPSADDVKGIVVYANNPAQKRSIANLGKAGVTKRLYIELKDTTNGIGIFATRHTGEDYQTPLGGIVNINGDLLEIALNNAQEDLYGLSAQNNTTDVTDLSTVATINDNATNTVITAKAGVGSALVAMSQGVLNINGNLEVNAPTAITTRGHSTVNINTQGKNRVVKLNGDIEFNYDKDTSGTPIDSNVDLRLTNADSYWTGASKITGNPPAGKDIVTGFKLTLANGAAWNVTENSFANDPLTMQGGKILAQEAVTHLKLENVQLTGAGNTILAPNATFEGTTIHFNDGAELITDLATAYVPTFTDDVLTDAKGKLKVDGSGILTINDTFTYTNAGLTALSQAYSSLTLNFNNAKLKLEATENTESIAIPDNATVTLNTDSADVAGGAETLAIAGNVVVKPSEEGSNKATLQNVALAGSAEKPATLALEGVETTAKEITLEHATLALGAVNGTTTEAVPETALTVTNLTVSKGAKVLVGNPTAKAIVNVTDFASGSGSLVFLDPAWNTTGQADVADASGLAIQTVTGDIEGGVIAGQNSYAAFGTDLAGAQQMINQLTTWGSSDVGAAIVVNTPIALADTGKVVADATNTSGVADAYSKGALTVKGGSMLIVNQAAVPSSGALINGALVFKDTAKLGVVNATEGEYTIANSGNIATSQIVTDNELIESTFANGVLTNKANSNKIMGTLSGLGMQALTRRADFMFASSIADRTSLTQLPLEGVNLWVDVQGERYEADRLAQGGSFHADMGYATFGGDVALTPTTRAGLAVQYADGTLRSDSLQAKNDYSSYGVSLYGSWQPVEWGKVVTEVAYVKGTNGIEAPRQALVSDVDTSMLSFGVRAQYQGSLGNFSIVPSIGLRVSRLETDALQFGTVTVEDDAQTLVQLPIALRVTAKPMDVASWTLAPSFKVAYVPTFGDKEYNFRGTKATVIDTAPVQGALGVRAMKGGFMLDADLMLGGGKQGTNSVGARVGARYTF